MFDEKDVSERRKKEREPEEAPAGQIGSIPGIDMPDGSNSMYGSRNLHQDPYGICKGKREAAC